VPLAACFQLVGHALNTLQQLTFQDRIEFYSRKRDWSSNFIVNLSSTLYIKGVFVLALLHKDNKLLSIYRNIKSQDDFIYFLSDNKGFVP